MSLWGVRRTGNGALLRTEEGLRLLTFASDAGVYSNAQLDDHAPLARTAFPWRPPVRLALSARFSHSADELVGTAGFGFWNDPFAMNGRRRPALPHAAWFFLAAPPSRIAPAMGVPGSGWKAAVIDVAALPFWALMPAAPIALPAMRLPAAYRALWPIAQRTLGAQEQLLTGDLTAWHHYEVDWGVSYVRFAVDGECVLECSSTPQGPLGIVIWMDNQYLVATPQGRFGWGVIIQTKTQWMEVDDIVVEGCAGRTKRTTGRPQRG